MSRRLTALVIGKFAYYEGNGELKNTATMPATWPTSALMPLTC